MASDGFVDAAWAAIGAADGFRLSLDLLTNNGLAATPPFVLVEWSEGADARIILRGDAPLAVTDASGSESLSASGVSTWVERSIPGVTAIRFSVPAATPVGTATLPLIVGVALVAEASVGAAVATKPVEVDVEETVREAPDAESSPSPVEDSVAGDTMYRSGADAVAPEPVAAETDEVPVVDDALHDGETVLTSDIAKMRGKRRPAAGTVANDVAPAQRLVLAISTTGAREALTQPLLIGRSPSVSKISSGHVPRLLIVGTPEQDISRNHVQVSLEGDTVVVTDLHSRNGTMVELPGKSPQKLRAGEPTSVILGTVIDLGSGVTLTVEESGE
ncbi:MAG: FHA domain-containing protein [Rhodoglobus sp.]|uniref:FHA domain-containing protein n=1 Tax=Salinibacterium sp. G-O1 TaxID=3046208 RepID=UPI0024BAF445|nr:FHA domain-containing protein [Salinibacterium sp. G-O1]MDJ0335785.1 FHA domain-containing protein [Salinibacterium sp. G-O1]